SLHGLPTEWHLPGDHHLRRARRHGPPRGGDVAARERDLQLRHSAARRLLLSCAGRAHQVANFCTTDGYAGPPPSEWFESTIAVQPESRNISRLQFIPTKPPPRP